ncbi:DUF3592 domain-containing protein [Planctomycetota bacterium]|nr:DUF3592 domain-containing protein [Planctomycetota bacterium]
MKMKTDEAVKEIELCECLTLFEKEEGFRVEMVERTPMGRRMFYLFCGICLTLLPGVLKWGGVFEGEVWAHLNRLLGSMMLVTGVACVFGVYILWRMIVRSGVVEFDGELLTVVKSYNSQTKKCVGYGVKVNEVLGLRMYEERRGSIARWLFGLGRKWTNRKRMEIVVDGGTFQLFRNWKEEELRVLIDLLVTRLDLLEMGEREREEEVDGGVVRMKTSLPKEWRIERWIMWGCLLLFVFLAGFVFLNWGDKKSIVEVALLMALLPLVVLKLWSDKGTKAGRELADQYRYCEMSDIEMMDQKDELRECDIEEEDLPPMPGYGNLKFLKTTSGFILKIQHRFVGRYKKWLIAIGSVSVLVGLGCLGSLHDGFESTLRDDAESWIFVGVAIGVGIVCLFSAISCFFLLVHSERLVWNEKEHTFGTGSVAGNMFKVDKIYGVRLLILAHRDYEIGVGNEKKRKRNAKVEVVTREAVNTVTTEWEEDDCRWMLEVLKQKTDVAVLPDRYRGDEQTDDRVKMNWRSTMRRRDWRKLRNAVLILVIIMSGFLGWGIHDTVDRLDWVKVTGEVLSIEIVEDHSVVKYWYEVDGKVYRAGDAGQYALQNYPIGKRVEIYYDPDDVGRASMSKSSVLGIYFLCGVLVLMWFGWFLMVIKLKPNEKQFALAEKLYKENGGRRGWNRVRSERGEAE